MAVRTRNGVPAHTVIKTPLAPAAIGPYSQGILAGDTLYCSGQIAIDPKTGRMESGCIVDQTERVLNNLGAILDAAGMAYENVVMCTLFLADISDYPTVNEIYSRYFNEIPPGRETVAVAGLPRGALIEISCVAVR